MRSELRGGFRLHRLSKCEVCDLRVPVKLIEELVDAAILRDQIVERRNALTGRKLLRFEDEVAQAGAIALRLQRLLRTRNRLRDPRPVALLESLIAIDVSLRPLEREPIERGRLAEHR